MNRIESLVLSLVAAALPAQGGAADTAITLRGTVPIHGLAADEGLPYGLWAAGDGYKASFHDGAVFVPYLGRDYPQSRPLRWRTTSVAVGGRQLVWQAPRLRHTATRAEYDLGGVIEAYDVLTEGLEQTFVVPRRPSTNGDLVVRGAIETTLRARPHAPGHEAVVFEDADGVAIARYGAATAIDAAGRAYEMTTVVDGDAIELRLSGDWLSVAAFPVTVDPLLAPIFVSSGPVIEGIAVAVDPLSPHPNYVVETRFAAAGDADLWMWRLNDSGTVAWVGFSDLTNQWSTFEPSVGTHLSAGRALVAFTRAFPAAGNRRVRLHRHLSNTQAFDGSVLFLDNADARNRWRPSVGNDVSLNGPTSLVVACQVESTGAFSTTSTSAVHAALVDVSASGSVLSQFVLAEGGLTDNERPSVASSSPGAVRQWTVAYQTYLNSGLLPNGLQWDVRVLRVDDSGGIAGSFVVPGGGNDQHQMAPRIAGAGARFMAFYTESSVAEAGVKPSGANGHRVRSVRLDWTGGTFSVPHTIELLHSDPTGGYALGGAAFDATTSSHWAASISLPSQQIRLRTFGHRGVTLTNELLDQATPVFGVALAGGVSPAAGGGFQAGYGIQNGAGSYPVSLRRRPWPALPVAVSGPSACTTTTISWLGSSVVGTDLCGVRLSNVPAGGIGAVVVATAPVQGQVFGVGGVHDGCWVLAPLSGPDHIGILGPAVGPEAAFALPLPEFLLSQVVVFQGVVFDPATNEFYSTRRLEVPIGF
jgi:hypothetical protein